MSLAAKSWRQIHFFPGKSQAQLATPHPEHVQNEPELFLPPIQKVSYFPVKTNKNNVQNTYKALCCLVAVLGNYQCLTWSDRLKASSW